jgi:DNA invertase Pin-like site-specific DNA recombinase
MSAGAAHDKVTASHLARSAYLYVRQSTLRQVVENTTSTERQYGLRQRAVALGWHPEQIVVIDDDLGRSGATSAGREGFQRLVGEVGTGRAGVVLGLEVSRLARNNADWQRLLEICALSDTLICDEDGLYDPAAFNDRLLLGLKGTMSEAELHVLRSRLRGGILAKARSGELALGLPVGLVYDPAGKVVLDPDTQVQGAISHLFATFSRTGSARATVATFKREGLLFPRRLHRGPRRGELSFTPLEHTRVLNILHNPRYAGAFCYGRQRHRRGVDGAQHSHKLEREDWTALIVDAHPGYISFKEWEHNQAALLANAAAHGKDRPAGPAREGPALLQGIVVCGRCGARMTIRYHRRRGLEVPDYVCQKEAVERAERLCQIVPGATIDVAIGELLVTTMTPLADELESRAGEADALRRAGVERSRQRAELARRRYLAVDPDNRLVADSLEADWNGALRELNSAQEDYERQRDASPRRPSAAEREAVIALASDFPALWSDPGTPQRERKRMARLLIEDVTLLRGQAISLQVRFRGGKLQRLELPVPLNAFEARRTPAGAVRRIDELLESHADREVALILTEEGFVSGDGEPFDAMAVKRARRAYGLVTRYDRLRAAGLLSTKEMTDLLGITAVTLRKWRDAGLVRGEKGNNKHEYLYYPPPEGLPPKSHGYKLSERAAVLHAQDTAAAPARRRSRAAPAEKRDHRRVTMASR